MFSTCNIDRCLEVIGKRVLEMRSRIATEDIHFSCISVLLCLFVCLFVCLCVCVCVCVCVCCFSGLFLPVRYTSSDLAFADN